MPNKQGAVWSIPLPRNPFFTGRTQVLDDLRRALTAGGMVALSGMGGIGKTQTAAEYAYRHRGEYKAVLWAKADSEDSLKGDFSTLAVKLNLPGKDDADRDKVVAAVKQWLEGQAGWLLILDNADELSLVSGLLRPEWGGHVLLTTRAHATGSISSVEIKQMEPEEGTLFLLRRAKLIAIDAHVGAATEADRELAEEITREVGGLPLALDQAGAFIEEMSSSLGEYLELYRKEGAQLRATRGGVASDHDPVTITFSLAFKQVEATSAAAADMLRACAFLAPDSIPEEIFSKGAAVMGENLASVVGGGLNLVKVIGEAGRFSLIRRDAKSGTIEMHRIVQQVLKDEMDTGICRVWAERVIRGMNRSFPQVEPENWPLCEKYLPHAQESAGLIGRYDFEFGEAGRLMNQAALYCMERAQYAEAAQLQSSALTLAEKIYGVTHPNVASSLNNLASLYAEQGKYAEAEQLYARALSIHEKAHGPDHPEVATNLNNLASLYVDQARYTEAEDLYERSLSIREKAYGTEHPMVCTALNNMAHLYLTQGKHAEAEPLLVRALSIFEKTHGPDHPNAALSINNLACVYTNQGRYAEAESLYTSSLGISEKTLGQNHPDVALNLHNLANLYEAQGKYSEAEPLYVRALDIYEKVFGPEHPAEARSLNNLAGLYVSQNKLAKAEPLYVRALAICEKALGSEHPNSVIVRNNYNHLLGKMRE